jgi:predicted RecB family endonuclease
MKREPAAAVEDAMDGYVAELVEARETLDSRYDDLKSGRVKPVPGDEAMARLRARSAVRRASHGSSPATPSTPKRGSTRIRSRSLVGVAGYRIAHST